jgi:MFS family permease
VARARETVSAVALAVSNRNVRRAELGWGASIGAEWVHFVALGVYAYRTGGTAAVGIAGLVRLLPAAVVEPYAASAVDRFRRERILLVTALVGAAALAASAAAAYAGARPVVYAAASVVGVATTLTRPALQALLPSLAHTPEELIAANGATSTIESLGTLAGPLLAGVLLSVASVGLTFAVASGATVAAAAFFTSVRVEGRVDVGARTSARRTLRPALETLARVPGARLVLGLMVVQTFVRGCLNVLIVVAAFRILGIGGGGVGYLTAAIGAGGLLGALRAMTLQGRRLAWAFALSLVCWGLPIALLASVPPIVVAVALLAVVGAANSIEDVAGFTLVQRVTPEESLNRVLGLFWGVAMGAVALGSLAAPAVVHLLGARPAFLAVGALLPVVTLLAYHRLVVLEGVAAPTAELELLERVPMFAPLSLAAKERLARRLVRVRAAAGTPVVRAGDVGDRFYVVRDGVLDVEAGDRRSALGPGAFFGEIALLRDVPRTATVTASTDTTLFALQREDFLAAVTGHEAAERAGRDVVDVRLGASMRS